jgi:hypothetical protein
LFGAEVEGKRNQNETSEVIGRRIRSCSGELLAIGNRSTVFQKKKSISKDDEPYYSDSFGSALIV